MNAELYDRVMRYEQEWAVPATAVLDFITLLLADGWQIIAPTEGVPA